MARFRFDSAHRLPRLLLRSLHGPFPTLRGTIEPRKSVTFMKRPDLLRLEPTIGDDRLEQRPDEVVRHAEVGERGWLPRAVLSPFADAFGRRQLR